MSINLTVVRGVRCSTELRYIAGHRACSCFQLVDFVCCDLCDKSRKQLGYAREQLSRPSCQYVPEQGRTRVQANLFAATHEHEATSTDVQDAGRHELVMRNAVAHGVGPGSRKDKLEVG